MEKLKQIADIIHDIGVGNERTYKSYSSYSSYSGNHTKRYWEGDENAPTAFHKGQVVWTYERDLHDYISVVIVEIDKKFHPPTYIVHPLAGQENEVTWTKKNLTAEFLHDANEMMALKIQQDWE